MKLGYYRKDFQICVVTFELLRDEAKGFWELIARRQKIEKGWKREMRARFFGLVGYINGRTYKG